MQITIAELQVIWDKLVSHLYELGYDTVAIDQDFYWDIPEDERYTMHKPPTELVVGQLSDDWAEVCKIIEGTDDTLLAYNFVWLAAVLRAIGEKVVG